MNLNNLEYSLIYNNTLIIISICNAHLKIMQLLMMSL